MGSVVLVTGCSSGGIGYALANEFARRGCTVYATARNPEKIADSPSPKFHKLKLDVNDDEGCQHVVDHIFQKEGRIDTLVNNAGIFAPGPLIDVAMDDVKGIFDTNTFAVLRLARLIIPRMAERRTGLILNIGSVVGETPTPWNGLYCATKAAMLSISDVLSMECKPFNISVMHIAPASVVSNISANNAARYTLPAGSLYASFLPNIMARIYASQNPSSMPTEEFARQVVSNAMRKRPPMYLSIGGNAYLFKILKWLPRTFVLWLMWRAHTKKLLK